MDYFYRIHSKPSCLALLKFAPLSISFSIYHKASCFAVLKFAAFLQLAIVFICIVLCYTDEGERANCNLQNTFYLQSELARFVSIGLCVLASWCS